MRDVLGDVLALHCEDRQRTVTTVVKNVIKEKYDDVFKRNQP